MFGSITDITQRKNTEGVLQAIQDAQAQFIVNDNPSVIFEGLLNQFLQLTESKFGFIGEVLRTSEDTPYLKTHGISNIAWNDETRELYKRMAPNLEFFNLDTLFGVVLKTGEQVIANDPAHDRRSGGLPQGHPPLHAFLGLPIHREGRLVGMLGIANRPGGYDEELVTTLEPLLASCGTLLDSYQNEQRRQQAEEQSCASLVALQEKEVLIQEIHHRVKNNLQVVSSILSLQAATQTDKHSIEVLKERQRRVFVMARLYDSLHHSGGLTSINVRDYLNAIVEDTKASSGDNREDLSFHLEADDIYFNVDQAMTCGQIISELLSNCLKHAFPSGQSGKIEISLRRREGHTIEMIVADDGKGCPKNFDIQKTETLGITLVRALTRQLNGVVHLDGGGGTRIKITFQEIPA